MSKFRIDHAAPYRTGGELYRIILSHIDEDGKLIRIYEVWASLEAIEDNLRTNYPLTQKNLVDFAERIYAHRLEDNASIAEFEGAFITNAHGTKYGDYRTFPGSMPDPDPYIQTNISLPVALHKWLRHEAVDNDKSISELIRVALIEYRKKNEQSKK